MKRYNTGGGVQLTELRAPAGSGTPLLPGASLVAGDGSHAAEGTAAGLQGPLQCCGRAMGWGPSHSPGPACCQSCGKSRQAGAALDPLGSCSCWSLSTSSLSQDCIVRSCRWALLHPEAHVQKLVRTRALPRERSATPPRASVIQSV